MNKKFLMNAAIASIVSALYGASSSNSPVIDDDAIIAAHAANFAYNITVNADGNVVLPPGLEGFEVLGDPHLAVGENKVQAVALKKGNQVIRSYRGTSQAQDWKANIGIAYAQSFLTPDPIIEHLLTGFKPALEYHGLDPSNAIAGVFGKDIKDIIGKYLSNTVSGVSPWYSLISGATNAITYPASQAAKFVKKHKAVSAGGGLLATTGGWFVTAASPFWSQMVAATVAATVATTAVVAPLNSLRYLADTGRRVAKYQKDHGVSEQTASQHVLLFNISYDGNHAFAEYFQDMYGFNQDVINSNEFPEDGAHITDTGHSLGGNLGMGSNAIANYDGKGGKIVGLSSITFASPNGLLGTYLALKDMGAKESLLECFRDPTALTAALRKAAVYSHEFDLVPRIGYKETPGNLVFMPTPPHYKPGRKADGITENHSMRGLLGTVTNTHPKTETDLLSESSTSDVMTSANTEEELRSEDDNRVAQSREKFRNKQIPISSPVVFGKSEAR